MSAAFSLCNTFIDFQFVTSLESTTDVVVLSTISSLVAIAFSIISMYVSQQMGKAPIIIFGATALFLVGFCSLIVLEWEFVGLIYLFSLLGIGRGTYVGIFRATLAEFFNDVPEVAFTCITVVEACTSVTGIFLFKFSLSEVCKWMIIFLSIIAMLGYWRAEDLFKTQKSGKEFVSPD